MIATIVVGLLLGLAACSNNTGETLENWVKDNHKSRVQIAKCFGITDKASMDLVRWRNENELYLCCNLGDNSPYVVFDGNSYTKIEYCDETSVEDNESILKESFQTDSKETIKNLEKLTETPVSHAYYQIYDGKEKVFEEKYNAD